MQQELPNLVDERRFRKREPEYERDELGRVSSLTRAHWLVLTIHSANGLKQRFQ